MKIIKPTYQELENEIDKLNRQIQNNQFKSSFEKEPIYHSLFKNITEGYAICEILYKNNVPIDFKYIEVNQAFENLTGLKDVVGKSISEILPNHLNENQELFEIYVRVSQSGISEKIETFVPSIEKWFSISVYSSVKEQFLVIFDNINLRKKSEEALMVSEAKFRGLFNQSPIGMAIVGLNKCFLKVNQAVCNFLGYTEIEMIGKTITDFTYIDDIELGMMDVKRMVEGEIEFARLQKRYLRKNGDIVWGDLTLSIVRNEQKKPLYFLPIIQDITEQYKTEKALKESETRFQELIKNSFDMIVLLDSNGIQRFVSKSCEKILGFKQEELMGISVIEKMIHPEDKEFTLQGFYDILNNKANGGIQYRHLHKNGGWVYLETFGKNQLDNPNINAIVLNIRDVTERKLTEQVIKENEIKLKELNTAKDKLFSIIAHDLRSPFNGILGFSELLIKNTQDLEVATSKKYLRMINSSAKNTLNLLENLLHWAKAQTGKINYNPQKIDLVSIIKEVLEIYSSFANAKNISLIYTAQSDKVQVFADENMLKVVLRNLISNAIKFTNPTGKIAIFTVQNKNYIEVTVSDNGVGITEEIRKKLFKIDPVIITSGTAAEKGSGLGLVLCKEFVEKQRGKIWVESKLGKGSSFKFTLPLNLV